MGREPTYVENEPTHTHVEGKPTQVERKPAHAGSANFECIQLIEVGYMPKTHGEKGRTKFHSD